MRLFFVLLATVAAVAAGSLWVARQAPTRGVPLAPAQVRTLSPEESPSDVPRAEQPPAQRSAQAAEPVVEVDVAAARSAPFAEVEDPEQKPAVPEPTVETGAQAPPPPPASARAGAEPLDQDAWAALIRRMLAVYRQVGQPE